MPQAKNPFGSSARPARRPASRISAQKQAATSTPPEDEKQRLILAHAAKRRTENDPTQVRLLWTGVIATFVVVLGAWGYATLPRILGAIHAPMAEVEIVQDGIQHATLMKPDGKTDDLAKGLAAVSSRLEAMNEAAAASEKMLNVMANQIEGTSTQAVPPVSRPELFQASSTSSFSTSTSL